VLSQQPETGVIVVKTGCRPETIMSVAVAAIYSQGSLVVVLMAVHALLPQAQESCCPIPELLIPDEFLYMALAAIDPSMCALKCIPRKGMVEPVPVKADHLKVPAMMVVVAGGTFLTLHFGGDMVTPVGINPGSDLAVAVQAFFVGNLLSQDMAFDAVGHPFQVGVGLRKVPGTELGQ